jgi:hypothetical protein
MDSLFETRGPQLDMIRVRGLNIWTPQRQERASRIRKRGLVEYRREKEKVRLEIDDCDVVSIFATSRSLLYDTTPTLTPIL